LRAPRKTIGEKEAGVTGGYGGSSDMHNKVASEYNPTKKNNMPKWGNRQGKEETLKVYTRLDAASPWPKKSKFERKIRLA